MGRPKIYHTKEDQKAASRQRSKCRYDEQRESICAARRKRYLDRKTTNTRASPKARKGARGSKTEEEKKVANRLKSKHHYERKKSEIKCRRQAGLSAVPPAVKVVTPSVEAQPTRPQDAMWEGHTAFLFEGYHNALGNTSVRMYLERIAARYIKDGSQQVLKSALRQFEHLLECVHDHQIDITNTLGAGAPLSMTENLSTKLIVLINKLKDMKKVAKTRGRDAFIDEYSAGTLLFQRKYA